MTKKVLLLILSIIIIISSFASCAKDDGDKNSYPGNKITPKTGGTLKMACVSIDTMNPVVTAHASVYDFLTLIYEGLFVVNEDLTVEGVLAESYSVSNNNTLYTVKLKENIKFHNGKIFTADDVVSTLNYMALYSNRHQDFMQYIDGYYSEGHHTLVVKLNKPKSDFAANFDFPILPTGLMSDDFLPQNTSFVPCGTGMYEYETTVAYKNIILKANDDWHGGDDRAYIDKVDIEILSDEETIISAFDAGAIDCLTTSWRGFGDIEITSSLFNTFENEQNRFNYVGINCVSNFFDTEKERRALQKSIDAKKITQDIMIGHAIVADSPVRDSAYYNTDDDTDNTADNAEDFQNGPTEFRLLYNSDNKTKNRIAISIKQQLEAAGYSVILDGQPKNIYTDKVLLGDYDLYIGEVQMTGNCDLEFMFSSPLNGFCNYDDSEFRTLVENLDMVSDAEDKKVAWINLEKYYKNAAIQIPLYFTNEATFVNKRINGKLKPNLSVRFYGLDDMFIDAL